jgi:hypothetical protein
LAQTKKRIPRGNERKHPSRGGYDQVTYNNDTTTTSGIVVHLAAGTMIGASANTAVLASPKCGNNFLSRLRGMKSPEATCEARDAVWRQFENPPWARTVFSRQQLGRAQGAFTLARN